MRIARTLTAVLLASSGVTGCDQSRSPSPEPLTTPTASPRPAPPEEPVEAKADSSIAAIAFVEHYIRVISYSIATGDTAALDAAALPSCKSCSAFSASIHKIYDVGGNFESNGWVVQPGTYAFAGPDSTYVVELKVRLTHEVVVRTPGAKPENHKATVERMRATIHRYGHEWKVQEIEIIR